MVKGAKCGVSVVSIEIGESGGNGKSDESGKNIESDESRRVRDGDV